MCIPPQVLSPLQLRQHGGGVPVAPHGLNQSLLIHFEDIDTLYDNIAAGFAAPAAGEFDRRPVARDEDMIRR